MHHSWTVPWRAMGSDMEIPVSLIWILQVELMDICQTVVWWFDLQHTICHLRMTDRCRHKDTHTGTADQYSWPSSTLSIQWDTSTPHEWDGTHPLNGEGLPNMYQTTSRKHSFLRMQWNASRQSHSVDTCTLLKADLTWARSKSPINVNTGEMVMWVHDLGINTQPLKECSTTRRLRRPHSGGQYQNTRQMQSIHHGWQSECVIHSICSDLAGGAGDDGSKAHLDDGLRWLEWVYIIGSWQ